MGQKCCRPQMRHNFPIHVIVLNDIYTQVRTLQASDRKQEKMIQPKGITESLNKKGNIRKLCDYLSSHHHYICDSLKLILMQIKNKKNSYNLIASAQVTIKVVKLTQQISTEVSSDEQQHKNSSKPNVLKLYQEFEQLVFEICLQILEQYLRSSPQVLSSLQQTVKTTLQILSEVSTEQLAIKLHHETIKNVLDLVVEVINSRNNQQKLALSVYRKIIQKYNFQLMSSNVYKDIVKEHLWKFLAYWVREVSQNLKKQQTYSKKRKMSEQQMSSIKDNSQIQAIFVEYFNSIFSYQQSENIYKQLMMIYDTLSFGEVLISVQGLVFSSLTQFQLKEQFLYRWFDYMLNYLAVTQDYFGSIWTISGFQQPYDSMKKKHKNILKQGNVVGCLQTVRRWVQQEQIDIGKILQYKSQKLFNAILLNLSNDDPNSSILDETCKILEYLVDQHPLFYVQLVYHIISIIQHVQEQFLMKSVSNNCKKYLQQLIRVISILNPQKGLQLFEFQVQKLEQYDRIYELIFQPLRPSKMAINKYLIKSTTEVLKKIRAHPQGTNYIEKLCLYLGSIAKLIQQTTDESKAQKNISQLDNLLQWININSPSILKPYLNYVIGLVQKHDSNRNLVLLMIEIYKNLDTTKNAQKVLNNKSKEPKAYRQSILSNIKKVGTIKKSDKNIKAAQKSFEILNMESTQIILDDGDKNSIESNGVGTSSLGNNDHNFVDVLQCIQKA